MDLNYGDPKAEEAVKLLLRAAAAEDATIAGPELTRICGALRADQRLLAWFVYISGSEVMRHLRDFDVRPDFETVELEQSEVLDALADLEDALIRSYRGEDPDADEPDGLA